MATNFPNSPSNGATHVFGGTTYTYNSTKGVWKADKDAIAVSDTPPSNPETGALWFDSSVAKTYIYYNDGSSSQWVQLNPSGGSDGAAGADATGDGESPIIYTEPPTSVNFATDGTASTVQMQAVDPEGTAITYGLAYANSTNALPDQLASATTIDQSTGTYTFTPSTTLADEGTFKARLSASDGIQTTTRFVNFALSFPMDATYLIVAGGGSGGAGVSGGGGGAGGLLYSTSGSFPLNTQLQVVVGAGGAAVTSNGDGNPGSNSSITGTGFTTLTAIGGGKGGGMRAGTPTAVELAGGSGGGGSGYSNSGTITGPGGNATAGQGNAGGTGSYNGSGWGGGGGGAGEAGHNHDATTDNSQGGDGLQYSISGTATYYAGGGGGGGYNAVGKAGGQGGGGPGGHRYGGNGATANATANTGGGGGGAGEGGPSGAGGSGIVIIRGPNTYSATGSNYTETTDGSDKIWTFTSDGTITFSV